MDAQTRPVSQNTVVKTSEATHRSVRNFLPGQGHWELKVSVASQAGSESTPRKPVKVLSALTKGRVWNTGAQSCGHLHPPQAQMSQRSENAQTSPFIPLRWPAELKVSSPNSMQTLIQSELTIQPIPWMLSDWFPGFPCSCPCQPLVTCKPEQPGGEATCPSPVWSVSEVFIYSVCWFYRPCRWLLAATPNQNCCFSLFFHYFTFLTLAMCQALC